MKHLKQILFSALLVMLISSISASAENPTNITISECDDINRVVTVSGTITTSSENENVILTVLKKDVTEDMYKSITPEEFNTALSYFGQKSLNSDGSFSFSFKFIGESGCYAVLIHSKALDGTYVTSLDFTNTLWDELKAAKDDETEGALERFRAFVEAEASSLGIDMTEYNALSDDKKVMVCTSLKAYEGDYTQAVFGEEWEKNVIWTFIDVNRNNSAGVAEMVAEKNAQGSTFFNQTWMTFFLNNYSDGAKTALYNSILSNTECNSLNKFTQMMKDSLVVVYVHNTEYWKELYAIIEAENNVLEFNGGTLATFSTLENKDAVVNSLFAQGKSCTASAQIISLFDTLVAAQKTAESTPVPTPTPRPSSGGGGGGWSVGIPSVTVPETNEQEPEEPVTTEQPIDAIFNDIADVEWAHPAIEYLTEKEILAGVGGGRFEPNRHMSREELVKMLDNHFGYSKTGANSDFADADKDAWYYGAVSGAAAKGIVTGYEDNTFGIGQKVTREDAAVILLRAFGRDSFGTASEPEFSDNDNISAYAKEAVGILSNSGIISGMGNRSFMPKSSLTRAEAAKMFYGLLMYIEA